MAERARVITYNVASIDGRLTVAPGVNLLAGDERWAAMTVGVGDPYQWPREIHDPGLFLEGSGSFLCPELPPLHGVDPGPPGEGEHFLPHDVVTAPGRRWFAVVDGQGAVDLQFTEWPDPNWVGWHTLVLTSLAAPSEHLAVLRGRRIPYLVVGTAHVALRRCLEVLHELLGVRTIVSTGGGRLGGALLREGLVDEIDVELMPWAIGGRGTPSLFDTQPLAPDQWPTHLRLLDQEALPDGRVRLRYSVADGVPA
ncbi:MAG TPA: dihydrofolate reductase family protein [Propionicimonas sp.]|uniref:dihydrofolate reductase family protein n=1 Tax=Propionicimonas sp. TaxID=1955623 RepID=UPI002F41F8B1